MTSECLIATLLLSPLLGFLINGFLVKKNNPHPVRAGVIATFASSISFICAVSLWTKLVTLTPSERHIHVLFFNWLKVGNFKADIAFLVDPISTVMILIITGVGTLIHLYSVGYMGHDAGPAKFFAYLNFFLFNMLILVL